MAAKAREMTRIRRSSSCGSRFLLPIILAFPSAGAAENAPQAERKLPSINPHGFTKSEVCGECHQAIHAVWQGSLHANSWKNGVFQAAYRRAQNAFGVERSRVCQSCHAPTVRHSKDYDVAEDVTAEGITCDFCHSVRSVDLDASEDPIRLDVGSVKYGPLKHAQSPAHKIVNSELHTRSEFCAPCHEYRNRHGLKILGTYSEWKASSYAKRGKQCQDCHMPLVSGRVVALDVKEDTPKSVNLHDVSGSHDLERVRQAIGLKLMGTAWIGKRVWVEANVANKGSGHCFPTGLPMHRAILEVVLREGAREVGRREIVFEMVTMDGRGRPIEKEHRVFFEAVKIRSDNRLRPEEVRTVTVPFRDVEASSLLVSVSLFYQYTTETLSVVDGVEHFEPAEMKFLIASARKKVSKPRR